MAPQPGSARSSPPKSSPESLKIREARPDDAEVCGRICYEAFRRINEQHGFPPDFPAPEIAMELLSVLFSHPGIYAVVAEADGKIVGSNCLDERSAIAGIGPITIDPAAQNRQVGRQLMRAVLDRAAGRGFPGVRLVQAAFHGRSLSLYSRLGFEVREPLVVMQGTRLNQPLAGYRVRSATQDDLLVCNRLCRRVHGHERAGELADAIRQDTAVVAERDGRVTAYATALGFFGHAVGETNHDLEALIATAPEFLGPGILVPTRNGELLRWCLHRGLRIVEPMTLMALGLYNEPNGAFLPSILY
jgi:GNAT superfamily N-acetyltransferase